jgi:organic hydroperoxide reductase OsmC/OhrA
MESSKEHRYQLMVSWTGNLGNGTTHYRAYERSHAIKINNKADILCSSDPAFRGDATKHNPEELLLASLSGCHMLWYLHLCSEAGVVVVGYTDEAEAIMTENPNGAGRFTEATLKPTVTVSHASMTDMAMQLHSKAHQYCFIANSMNFPVKNKPSVQVSSSADIGKLEEKE